MIKVEFYAYDGEAYDLAVETVMASPGWQEMTIYDMETFDEGDAVAQMIAYFDTDAHAMLFRLRQGV